MTPLVLAHGPIGGTLLVMFGEVTLLSLVIAVGAWRLAGLAQGSSRRRYVPLVVIAAVATLLSWTATFVWLVYDWTIVGPAGKARTDWQLLLLFLLPAMMGGSSYVLWRRARLHQGRLT